MLLAYLDEIGEPGAYISPDHKKFNTCPAFGYAGFIIPEEAARSFGQMFYEEKKVLFASEIGSENHPGRWERKGSSVFRRATQENYPEQFRVFNFLVRELRHRGGRLFYYADEKPLGTPKQTDLNTEKRQIDAMREVLNRLARRADTCGHNLLAMMDQVNEKQRKDHMARMYGHIYSRMSEHGEMGRIVEPPMHIDSKISSNIQFADWVAACVTRYIDYQLVRTSKHRWVVEQDLLNDLKGAFTQESKLHLYQRSVQDLYHSQVLEKCRPLYPQPGGQHVGESIDPDVARKMRGVAQVSRR